MAQLTASQVSAVNDVLAITKDLADLYLRLKSANQRFNGAEALNATAIADIIAAVPALVGVTQPEWDGLESMVGLVYGAVDGNFEGVAKIRAVS